MDRVLKALKDRRTELMNARKENHIRLSELDKITMKIKQYTIDSKIKKPDKYVAMNLVIMAISSTIDDIHENKFYKKEMTEQALRKLFDEKKISNEELNIALDILKEDN